jgi:thiazole/oxazole-forming peptide maturase SagD family component
MLANRLPANWADDFSFWTTNGDWLIELKSSFSVHLVDQETAILLGQQYHRIVKGVTLVSVLGELRQSTSIKNILERLPEVRGSVVYKILYDLCTSGLINVWNGPVDKEISFEISLVGRPSSFNTTILLTTLQKEETSSLLPSISEALVLLGFNTGHIGARPDFCLLLADTYLNPNLFATATLLIADYDVIPVKLSGADLWVGPILHRGAADFLAKFHQRLLANHPLEARIIETGMTASSFDRTSSWSSQLGANVLARILSEHLAAPDPVSLRDNCITFSYRTLSKRLHPTRALTASISLVPQVSGGPAVSRDGGRRQFTPAQFLAQVEDLISPITGLVPDLLYHSPAPGIHVYQTVQIEPVPVFHRLNRRFGSRFGAAGKGETLEQARASCVGEALERYSSCYQGSEILTILSLAQAEQCGLVALDPRLLMLFSERQYRDRAKWRRNSFQYVPEPFDPEEPIGWLSGTRWTDNAPVLVPAAYTLFNYNDHRPIPAKETCFADSNGCAVGSSLYEAMLHGACELIERDACAIWWYNRLKMPAFNLESARSSFISTALKAYSCMKRELLVLDLTNDIGIPVACAISWNEEGKEIGLGLGCDLDSEIAVSRAICELNQFIAGLDVTRTVDGISYQDDIVDWIANTSIRSVSYLLPNQDKSTIQASTGTKITAYEELREVVHRLANRDLTLHYVDLSRPETGVFCARVIVPGLRHFWARFAPGRLYEVPVQLGWSPAPLNEDDLNPTPFFL